MPHRRLCLRVPQVTKQIKTTIVEATHLTLVEANSSLIYLPLQTYEKKFAELPFLFIFIIPWTNKERKLSKCYATIAGAQTFFFTITDNINIVSVIAAITTRKRKLIEKNYKII